MFNWLKKLFGKKEPVAQIQITEAPKLLEKPCRNCGNPVFYDPSWEHIPNYCKDCKRKFQQSNAKAITRKCRNCGRKISFPSTIEHYYNDFLDLKTMIDNSIKWRKEHISNHKCFSCGDISVVGKRMVLFLQRSGNFPKMFAIDLF